MSDQKNKQPVPIYLDYQASTPCDPRVVAEMLPFFSEQFGNASSRLHRYGWTAAEAVILARKRLAELIGAKEQEIIFTSGTTEANNLALKGVIENSKKEKKEIVISAVEHSSIIDTVRWLKEQHVGVTILPVDSTGIPDLYDLRNAISLNTILVSVMMGNNEIGTILPVEEIGNICREKEIYFHTDAAQCAHVKKIDLRKLPVDLLSLSAHKMYGPKGIGLLYRRISGPFVGISPQIHGGAQEWSLRAGTVNVPAIVGFGKAAEIAANELIREYDQNCRLRDLLEKKIVNGTGARVNGSRSYRLPHNLSITFPETKAERLLDEVRNQVAASTGSACLGADESELKKSHVLKAIGFSDDQINKTIRLSVGKFITEEEIEIASDAIIRAVSKLQNSHGTN